MPDRRDWIRTVVASMIVGATGGALLWSGTDGFRAFTTEQARRLAVERAPRALPPIALQDQDGRPFILGEYEGSGVAVNFVYTQCTTSCGLLSAAFQRVHVTDPEMPLVSISFDPRDTPERLRDYGSHFGADGATWRFAAVRDTNDIPRLLRTFGVVVIPDGNGDFQHNAAVHVIDGTGRLSRILDLDVWSRTATGAGR